MVTLNSEQVYQLKNRVRGLIDSEYDNVKDFTSKDLWEYLSPVFPNLTREMCDEIFEEIF